MHELAVCQSLLREVERVARQRGARVVTQIHLSIGPLSGVEADLLRRAFTIARTGTVAARAALVTEPAPVRVSCSRCERESAVPANRLLCPRCGEWRTRLVSGDEMALVRVEMNVENHSNQKPLLVRQK